MRNGTNGNKDDEIKVNIAATIWATYTLEYMAMEFQVAIIAEDIYESSNGNMWQVTQWNGQSTHYAYAPLSKWHVRVNPGIN